MPPKKKRKERKNIITLESSISDSKAILYFSHLSGTCLHVLRFHDDFALKKTRWVGFVGSYYGRTRLYIMP